MTDLGIYTTSYREHYLIANFIRHPQGIMVELKVGPLPWMYFDETPYPTYEKAKSAAVAEGRRLIDQFSAPRIQGPARTSTSYCD